MKRKHKLYSKPKKAFELSRIKEENSILEKYGLKNKREIWKTIAKVNYFRRRAKSLAKSTLEEQNVLFSKLQAIGLKVNSIADVLALTAEDLLKRRLQTIVKQRGMGKTMKHARQLITHKKILINKRFVDVPSYLVSVEEENSISLKPKKVKQETKQEVKANSQQETKADVKEANA